MTGIFFLVGLFYAGLYIRWIVFFFQAISGDSAARRAAALLGKPGGLDLRSTAAATAVEGRRCGGDCGGLCGVQGQQRQLAVVAAVAMQQAPGGVAAQKNGLPPRSPTLARSSSAPMAWGLGPILERPVNNSTSLMSTMMMSPGRQDMNNGGAPAPSPGPQMSPTTFSADADF